jgi:hypothetical protein
MIPSADLLISKTFFQKEISAQVETHKAIGQILLNLAKNPTPYIFKKFQRSLNLNAQHVKDSEDSFANAMKSFLHQIDPNCLEWKAFETEPNKRKKILTEIRSKKASIDIALGYLYVVRAALVLEGKVPNKNDEDIFLELNLMAEQFITIYPEPIALYKTVMENLLNSEFNLFENSRSNFLWDISLMFNVGQNTIQNSKIIFVTTDAAMIRSALQTNNKNAILTFTEYMEYLGLK